MTYCIILARGTFLLDLMIWDHPSHLILTQKKKNNDIYICYCDNKVAFLK